MVAKCYSTETVRQKKHIQVVKFHFSDINFISAKCTFYNTLIFYHVEVQKCLLQWKNN